MGMGNGIGCPYIPNIGYPGNPPGYPGILPDSPELKSPLIKKNDVDDLRFSAIFPNTNYLNNIT